jgi:hypothetical protein
LSGDVRGGQLKVLGSLTQEPDATAAAAALVAVGKRGLQVNAMAAHREDAQVASPWAAAMRMRSMYDVQVRL